MKKQIIKIALYDGWRKLPKGVFQKGIRNSADFCVYNYLSQKYSTNLNLLHRVALDVIDEMDGYEDKYFAILDALQQRPIRGKYTHLIKAVADGIDYLNTKKI